MKNKMWVVFLALGLMFLSACGGGGDSGSKGTINVGLTDTTTTEYQAIYVTVKQVEVQKNGNSWNVIATPNKTFNLLELVNGVIEELAVAKLETGHYNQMRLILADQPDGSLNIFDKKHLYANYFINQAGESVPLKVPSGFQTGFKIVKGFDINTNQTTELILDFDATRSIIRAGSSGKWLLKPTIKMLTTKECSVIEGNVGAEGILVSAQIYHESAELTDRVQIAAATVSDADGNYHLFLEPGIYTLVGYKDGFDVYYKETKIVTEAGKTYTENFSIGSVSQKGSLATGDISISGADTEQYATFSIRQDVMVDGNLEQIEFKSFNVANGGTVPQDPNYPIYLPVGNYSAIISTYGKQTIAKEFAIATDSTTNLGDINF